MNARRLSLLNREKRAQLTEESKEVYEQMLEYVRTANLIGHHSEEVLMDVLDHLLEAQENGKTAFDVVGKEPKVYCDELIEALPKPTFWQRLHDSFFAYIGMLAVLLIGDTIVSFFLNQAESKAQTFIVNPLGILLIILLTSTMLFLSPKHSRKTAFMKKKLGSKLFNGALFVMYWGIGTAATKGYLALKKAEVLTITTPIWIGIILSLIFGILYKLLSSSKALP